MHELPLDEIFNDALELTGRARDEYLDRVCGAEADLRAEVERLLRAFEADPDVLDRGPAAVVLRRRIEEEE